MIYIGSRYEDDTIDRVQTSDGGFSPTIYHDPAPLLQVFDYSIHLTVYGERLDSLAASFLGDPELYWVIANANPELLYPDDIPVGTALRIPRGRILG